MTEPYGWSLSRVVYDIAQTLDSPTAVDERLGRVLELLRRAVPFGLCALLDGHPARPRRLVVVPGVVPDEQTKLVVELEGLLTTLTAQGWPSVDPPLITDTLAVPLVELGKIIGVLFVRRAEGGYGERHLRTLAIVAGQLAVYLSMVRAHDDRPTPARDLGDANAEPIAADRAKAELRAVMSQQRQNPIAATLGWAHVLVASTTERPDPSRPIERQPLPPAAREGLRFVMRAIEPIVDSPQLGPVISGVVIGATLLAPVAAPLAGSAERYGDAGSANREPVLEGIRILVVDDDPDFRQAFVWMLEQYGADVTMAGSAGEALAAFGRSRPDVLLSDVCMPRCDGYGLMRQIAALDATLPAAALTAFGALANPARAIEAGFRTQLPKPVEIAVVVSVILELVGRRAAHGRFVL